MGWIPHQWISCLNPRGVHPKPTPSPHWKMVAWLGLDLHTLALGVRPMSLNFLEIPSIFYPNNKHEKG
jgi:hypothetical protein